MTQPVATPPARRWYTPLLAGDLAALWPALVVAFAGVLAIAFTMSYHGLFIFGREIMGWPTWLCALAPIGLDVLSMVGLFATFIVRDAAWRVRAYMWSMFGATVALSVLGNATAAIVLFDSVATVSLDVMRWGYRQVGAVVGAAVWPAASAAALHALIIVKRHIDRQRDKIKKVAEVEQLAVAERRAVEAEERCVEAERQRVAATQRQADIEQRAADAETQLAELRAHWEDAEEQILRARAIELAATGATAAAINDELDLDPSKRRSVERWTEPVRTALATAKVAVPAKAATRRVNGRVDTQELPKPTAR